jgi:hypothetical protein
MKLISLLRCVPSTLFIVVKRLNNENIFSGFCHDLRFTINPFYKSLLKNNVDSVSAEDSRIIIKMGRIIL